MADHGADTVPGALLSTSMDNGTLTVAQHQQILKDVVNEIDALKKQFAAMHADSGAMHAREMEGMKAIVIRQEALICEGRQREGDLKKVLEKTEEGLTSTRRLANLQQKQIKMLSFQTQVLQAQKDECDNERLNLASQVAELKAQVIGAHVAAQPAAVDATTGVVIPPQVVADVEAIMVLLQAQHHHMKSIQADCDINRNKGDIITEMIKKFPHLQITAEE